MRIAIDASRTVVARRTGTERYALELIRGLLRIDGSNEYLLYFNQSPPPGLIPPRPNWRARQIPLPRLWTHLRLGRELARDRPDLLFVPAHVLPLAHPERSVVTVHDLGFRFFPRAHPVLSRLYLELSTRWAARRASHLIAVSKTTARELQRIYGVAAERISVVYEGIDPHFRRVREPATLANRYGLDYGSYLLAVGTLQPRKNLLGLLRAYRIFLDENDCAFPLAVAGAAGWGLDAFEKEVGRLGLSDRVRRLGYVPDEDLPALYSGAFAYITPSLYEGFGLTALEALACGTPVVAANTSALPEVVGDAALLVDPRRPEQIAAALSRLLREPATRGALAQAGPRQAAAFTWERCARETLAVLQQAGAR